MRGYTLRLGSLLALAVCFTFPVRATPPTVLSVDLPTLIDQVAPQPERFAVAVPQRISADAQGEWSSTGSRRVWTYSVQIPTAVSMSFHASRLAMPTSAVLSVSGAHSTVSYRARDVSRGGLWSRPLLGDTLTLSLSVAASEAGAVQLQIDSLQAGYRGLGGANAASTQSCTENYSCDATTANQGPAHATVAVLIGNQYQCTGTLLNNTSGDLTPYVLTARHCESGQLGGGAPQNAGSMTVYWDAVSPCGAVLGSIYDGSAPQQGGASTVVEQQDAWLVRLDAPPVVSDAYWAGWDATGSVFTGGYSLHHALGYNKQYVGWYGQAILQHIPSSTLNAGYDSTFWGLVNQLGNVGSGASGSAVFDPNNHVVGSGSLAALQSGGNSAGVCPVNPPPVPAPSTVTAQYTALSAVFASTADATSTTGSTTLQSVLDPGGTGHLVMAGTGLMPMTLTADQTSPTTLGTLTLSWSVAGAQSCTASGGAAGDGWAGARPASGSAKLVNYSGGQVTYTLSCSAGDLTGHASVSVDWIYVPPSVSLNGPLGPVLIGGAVSLAWSANVSPCVASGGISGDGWSGAKPNPGQQTVTGSRLGTLTYTLTCGSGPQSASAQASVTVVPLSVTMTADSTQIRTGSYATLLWRAPGSGDNCSGSGGAPGDNWAQQIALGSSGSAFVTETAAGSYTYTINCTGGGQSASSNVTIVFTNAAAAITISAVSPTQQVYPDQPGISPTTDLLWNSNLTPCVLAALGPVGNTSVTLQGRYPSGTAADAQFLAGHYVYQLSCGTLQASTSVDWTTPNPTVTLTTGGPGGPPITTWVANYPYQLWWTTNTTPCTQTGGVSGDGWAGNYGGAQGSETVTEAAPGRYTFTVACGTGSSAGQAQLSVTVPPPAVSISATPAGLALDQVFTLTWNSTVAPCSSVVPGAVNWGGSSVAPSGSMPVIPTATGTFTYAITCGTGGAAVQASTRVTIAAAAPTTVSASATTAIVTTPIKLTWSSPASVCTAVGGDGNDGWNGSLASSGTMTVTSPATGTVTYGINCSNVTAQTQVTYTAPSTAPPPAATPAVTLASSLGTQTTGKSVTLSWSSEHSSSCTASGGVSGDGWSGSLALSGSMQITEPGAGADSYTITCVGAPPAANAQVTVDFSSPDTSGSGSASTGGGGGGGAFDPLWLLILSTGPLARVLRKSCAAPGRARGLSKHPGCQ